MNPDPDQLHTSPQSASSVDSAPEQSMSLSGVPFQTVDSVSPVSSESSEAASSSLQTPTWQAANSPSSSPAPAESPAPAQQPVITPPEPNLSAGNPSVQSSEPQPQGAATHAMPPAQFSLAGSPVSTTMQPVAGGKRRTLFRKPAVLAGVVIAAVLVLTGGIVFGLYLPNTPESIYSAGLANTGAAFDRLIEYSDQENAASYKGVTYDGTFKLKSPSVSADATISGASDGNANATFSATIDAMGQKGSVNVRSVHAAGNTNPDVYIQVNGIGSWLEQAGLNGTTIDGQWISIDHTLIDTYTARLKSAGSSAAPSTGTTQPPTYAQVADAARKVQAVNKQYIFTTDGSRAVWREKKFIGTETSNGRTLNHYTVGWSKQHITAYLDALKTALDSSKLNAWAKASNGSNLSSAITAEPDVSQMSDTYTFDLWVDTGTRLVSKLVFKDPSDPSSVFTLSQNYQGGSTYPFTVASSSKNLDGSTTTTTAGFTIDTSTHKYTFALNMDTSGTSGQMTMDMTVHATPSNSPVKVAAPAGAKSFVDMLDSLGLGALGSGLGGDSGSGPSLPPLVLQQ